MRHNPYPLESHPLGGGKGEQMSQCSAAAHRRCEGPGVMCSASGGGARLQGLRDACVGCEERMGTCQAHRMREES